MVPCFTIEIGFLDNHNITMKQTPTKLIKWMLFPSELIWNNSLYKKNRSLTRISLHYEYASAVMMGLIVLDVKQRDATKHI